ncbi:hypothetical protein [Legionella sp. km772]|uniref:hypothetical protein n=1 Tax=Legionella sp. km772 TaxID=2498111 RepID=UPI000F8E7732|nr:hypothetical protein [Legionella sp. km772]RUR04143.1 hypothetical protein ELY15_15825 [Legionella sp. km772]
MISKKTSLGIAKICGIMVFLLGLVFIASFLSHKNFLIQLTPKYTPLKINTIICFTISSVGLLSLEV